MIRNKRGFTLIELLAVITIIGILMMLAIPVVSRVVENSRRDIFVDSAKAYANVVRNLWTADELTCDGVSSSAVVDGDYYVLINTDTNASGYLPKLLESGGKSPWGNQNVNGYVRINVSTKPAEDRDGDGVFEIEPKRVFKYYVALSDGLHGVVDDGNTVAGNLSKNDVILKLSEADLKKIELTTDDGELDCAYDENGDYSCTAVTPIKDITGICVDDGQAVNLSGRVERLGENFSLDDWGTIVTALKSGNHPYQVGDTKTINMGSLGNHKIRIANLSTPSECNNPGFSQTACGVVLEFADNIEKREMHFETVGTGWEHMDLRAYINNDIYNILPEALRNGIIDTYVLSGYKESTGEKQETIDKLYLFSTAEIWQGGMSTDTTKNFTRQLDYYRDIGVTTEATDLVIKKSSGTNKNWWLRVQYNYGNGFFYNVRYTGEYVIDYARSIAGVSPAFRLA